jgi:hypothetical protein
MLVDDDEAEAAGVESFVWEDISNDKGQSEQFRARFGPQNTVQEIVETFELFFSK